MLRHRHFVDGREAHSDQGQRSGDRAEGPKKQFRTDDAFEEDFLREYRPCVYFAGGGPSAADVKMLQNYRSNKSGSRTHNVSSEEPSLTEPGPSGGKTAKRWSGFFGTSRDTSKMETLVDLLDSYTKNGIYEYEGWYRMRKRKAHTSAEEGKRITEILKWDEGRRGAIRRVLFGANR